VSRLPPSTMAHVLGVPLNGARGAKGFPHHFATRIPCSCAAGALRGRQRRPFAAAEALLEVGRPQHSQYNTREAGAR
jgi:hypothetical protein